jgi:hypothetical protein
MYTKGVVTRSLSHDNSTASARAGSTQSAIQCSFSEDNRSAVFSNEDEAAQRNYEWGNVPYRYPTVSTGSLLGSAVTAEIVAKIFKLRLDIKIMHYFQDTTFTDKFEP